MKPEKTLRQKLLTDEYVYSTGKVSREQAESRIESLLCEGEVSEAEQPRAVAYRAQSGTQRWAIVLTDTGLSPYV